MSPYRVNSGGLSQLYIPCCVKCVEESIKRSRKRGYSFSIDCSICSSSWYVINVVNWVQGWDGTPDGLAIAASKFVCGCVSCMLELTHHDICALHHGLTEAYSEPISHLALSVPCRSVNIRDGQSCSQFDRSKRITKGEPGSLVIRCKLKCLSRWLHDYGRRDDRTRRKSCQ